MRKIKFRAWNPYLNHFEKECYLEYGHNKNGLYVETEDEINEEMVRLELQQYTGLKDKNGVEIYGGDIVRCSLWETYSNENGTEYNDYIAVAQVKYVEEEAKFILCDENEEELSETTDPWTDDDNLEVIGNIYENPELLGDLK